MLSLLVHHLLHRHHVVVGADTRHTRTRNRNRTKPRSFSALQRGAVGEVDGAAGAARRGALAGAPGEVLPRGVGAGHVRPLRARDRAAD